MAASGITTVLEPEDEYPHEPDAAANYNESMYLNVFDAEQEIGGWFRLGNRVNEGYAEMSVCLYLPGGRVGFMYGRPEIATNDAMDAGGLQIEVVTPFEQLTDHLRRQGLPARRARCEMADPRRAFADNPMVDCTVRARRAGIVADVRRRPVHEDGTDVEIDAEKSFAKAHYEQHVAMTGTITVGDETFEIDGLGPARQVLGAAPLAGDPLVPLAADDLRPRLRHDDLDHRRRGPRACRRARAAWCSPTARYDLIRECTIESDWDDHGYQTGDARQVRTDERHATR